MRSLQFELELKKRELQARLPESVTLALDHSIQTLKQSGAGRKVLSVGDRVPDFVLTNTSGKRIGLKDTLRKGPVVLTFFRGDWCPYCQLQLFSLQKQLYQIRGMGGTLLAVSPQTPERSRTTAREYRLTYELLSDDGHQVARQFGISYALPPEARKAYEQSGVRWPGSAGSALIELPLVATYVIDAAGYVTYAFVEEDFTRRAHLHDILAALYRLRGTHASVLR